nr:MAG TPA: hypothetical protein [Bacteriophage sp.]
MSYRCEDRYSNNRDGKRMSDTIKNSNIRNK